VSTASSVADLAALLLSRTTYKNLNHCALYPANNSTSYIAAIALKKEKKEKQKK